MPPELKAMEQRLDSLKGEERFSFLMELAQAYAQVDVQQSRGFLKEAVALSKDLNRHDFTARALNGMGITYFIQGDLHSALDYYKQSLEINESNNDSSGLAVKVKNLAAKPTTWIGIASLGLIAYLLLPTKNDSGYET